MGMYGQHYEITLALQLAVQGRYDESEQHLRRAEELAPAIRDPQAIAPTIGVQMRLLLARGHHDVGDAVHRIEPMIDDPIAHYIVPLIARVEATGALLAHDANAPRRISRLVDLLRTVHDSIVPGGYLARNVGAWLSVTEAELSRANDEAAPGLWREALLRIREVTYAEHELYAAVSVKCSSWCRWAGRIVRSARTCSSARRPPASMYPTSWPSLEWRTEWRLARRRGR
jgi:hypothetical protein